jgi:hypothetical protein
VASLLYPNKQKFAGEVSGAALCHKKTSSDLAYNAHFSGLHLNLEARELIDLLD